MTVTDYIDHSGTLRAAHNGVRTYGSDTVLGARTPGTCSYGKGSLYPSWSHVRENDRIDTDPSLDPPPQQTTDQCRRHAFGKSCLGLRCS